MFVTAEQSLLDLATQDSARALDRRLRHYGTRTSLLVSCELGYLSIAPIRTSSRSSAAGANLVLTTNLALGEWPAIFLNAASAIGVRQHLEEPLAQHCAIRSPASIPTSWTASFGTRGHRMGSSSTALRSHSRAPASPSATCRDGRTGYEHRIVAQRLRTVPVASPMATKDNRHPQAPTTDTRSARGHGYRLPLDHPLHDTEPLHHLATDDRPAPRSVLGLRPDPVRPIEIRPKERHIVACSPP